MSGRPLLALYDFSPGRRKIRVMEDCDMALHAAGSWGGVSLMHSNRPNVEAASSLVFLSMDTLGIEPRAFRMRSGCDTTTPCAPEPLIRAPRLSVL